MNENVKPFPDDPQARMRRLLKKRMEEAEASPSEPLPEHIHGNYRYTYDPERGELTVWGPAGTSLHASRPSGVQALLDYDGEDVTHEQSIEQHYAAVNEIYDLLEGEQNQTE